MKVLFTGFEPFGGESINPSYEAVIHLPQQIGSAEIFKAQLPVSFAQSGPALEALLTGHQPDAVICVGQAGGYTGIALERVAINLRDATTPDNDGVQPVDEPVVPGSPAAYFSSLPVKDMAATLKQNGIPAFVSLSAGTYVCNNVMYTLLHLIERKNLPIRGGFIHVPYSMEQAAAKPSGTPSMAQPQMTRALELVVRTLEND